MKENVHVLSGFDEALIKDVQPPAVSLYLTLHGRSFEREADRLQFKNLCSEAERRLSYLEKKRSYARISENLAYAADSLDEIGGGGMAFFLSGDEVRIHPLPYVVEPRVAVGERYCLKPLMRDLSFDSSYYLLGLFADRFTLSRGDLRMIEHVDLPLGLHAEFGDSYPREYEGQPAFEYEVPESHLSPYHNYRSKNDVVKEETEKFFRYVDNVVTEFVCGARRPVILVALPEHQALFRGLTTLPCLHERGIEKDMNGMGAAELLEDASALIEDVRAAQVRAALKEYGNAQAEGRGSTQPAEIGRALAERKVSALFVTDGPALAGDFDEETGAVSLSAKDDAGCCDIADEFAQAALRQGAVVRVVDAEAMPGNTGMAAQFRY